MSNLPLPYQIIWAALAVFLDAAIVRAELPPSAYRNWQKQAPEALTIKVISLQTTTTRKADITVVEVVASARVVAVERSDSDLRVGAVIRISYTHCIHHRPIAGPSDVPLLQRGKEYPAFLDEVKPKLYVPAAGGYSFQKLVE